MADRPEYEAVASRGVELFLGKLNCAEATLLALCEYYQVDLPYIPSVATPFGAGISQWQTVCGALTGALMMVGIRRGRQNAQQSNAPAFSLGQQLIAEFGGVDGKINCMDWVKHQIRDPEAHQQFLAQKGRETICAELVRRACIMTLNALEQTE